MQSHHAVTPAFLLRCLRPAITACTLSLSAFALLPAAAQVAGRPITIIVPYTPGTGIDILARALGVELTKHWSQPVVVDNKPGASGNIGTQVASRAAPDGQTLLMIAKTFVTNGSLFKSVPYDPVKSFVPVIKLATGSIVLAVHPSVPADSVSAFVQYVKARPGEVNYGSPGFATPHHLAMELFKHATQTNLVHIPYKGTSGVMSDLVGNHVSAMFVPTHVALPLAADKQIRILGVASAERVAAAPDVPTLAEQGVTGFEVDIWFGLLAPAGTPADVVARYNEVINEFLRSPPVMGALAKQGLITAGGAPAVLGELIASDMAKWQRVIQQAGITAE
jgi:tripartite-type tricarboxylate transporter receptor subunit TctC